MSRSPTPQRVVAVVGQACSFGHICHESTGESSNPLDGILRQSCCLLNPCSQAHGVPAIQDNPQQYLIVGSLSA